MESPTRKSSDNTRSHRRFRINKISTTWPTTRTTSSSSSSSLFSPIPISPSLRTPRRKRISASWLGISAWEPAWEYGHLRFHEEQERWEREEKERREESWMKRILDGFLLLLNPALIYEVAGWVWVAGTLGLVALTVWAAWEYAFWKWERWVEGRGVGRGKVCRILGRWRRIWEFLVALWDLVKKLGFLLCLQLRDSTPGFLVRKILDLLGVRTAVQYSEAILGLQLVGRAGKKTGDGGGGGGAAAPRQSIIVRVPSKIPGTWPKMFSPRFAKYQSAETDCDDGFSSSQTQSSHLDKGPREMVKQLRKRIHDTDSKASRTVRPPLSTGIATSDVWVVQEQEVEAGAGSELQLGLANPKQNFYPPGTHHSDDTIWKPYWSRSLDKPVYFATVEEVIEGSDRPNTPVALTRPLAITPRTPAVQVQTPRTSIQEEIPRPLGNVAMLQRWLSKVSDLCQACDALWHLYSRITLQQVKQECEIVQHLDVRVAWGVVQKEYNDKVETEVLVGIERLRDVRERETLVDSDDEILYDALTLMKALLSRVKNPEHQRTKGKRKSRPSTIISDGWSLSQVHLVRREVRQLAQSRLQILDSVYLLGQAYPTEKLVAEHHKLECQLWPLLAQAKLLGLGTQDSQLHRAIADVEETVYSEVDALQTDLERADFTRSLNEHAGIIARDMPQDSTMTGLSPTTPKLAFGHTAAGDDDIDKLKEYISSAAKQVDAIGLLESADYIRSAHQIETEIRKYLSKLSNVADYSNEHVRDKIDEIFEMVDNPLLVLRVMQRLDVTLPIDRGLHSARGHADVNFSPIQQQSEPPTPAQLIHAKERRTEQPSDYAAKRALWQQEYTQSFGAHKTEVPLLWPFNLESFDGDRLTLKRLHNEVQSTVEELRRWRTSFERLTSVYDQNGSTSNRNATHMGQPNLRDDTGTAGAGRSAMRVWLPAADLAQDGSINHQILLPLLSRLNDIRGKAESVLLKIDLERRKMERDNTGAQDFTQLADLERTATQTLDYVFQCLLDLGARSSQLDQTKVTFEQAQLYARVACWVGVRQGSFFGRYNNLAQLEDAQRDLETKFDAVKTKACGQTVPIELRNMALILDQLAYHCAGTDRLAEVCTAPLDAAGIREVRKRTKKLQDGLRDAYTWTRERHNQQWFLDGPPGAIANLQSWVRAGKAPSTPDDEGHLCGARALLISLQTCLKAEDGLMFDGRIPGPEDAEELLRRMFVGVDDVLALVPVPTKSPGNLAEPTPEYAAFVHSRLSSIEDEHGLDSNIYRHHWDEARAVNDWTPRQLQNVFEFLAQGHVFELPAVDLRLSVVTRDVDDSHNQTTATVEFFGGEDEVETSTVLWVYYDNAANLSGGAVSHWHGFSSHAEVDEEANAVVSSWFMGTRLPRPAGSVRQQGDFALQPPPPAREGRGRGDGNIRGGRGDRGHRGSLARRGGRAARTDGQDGPGFTHTGLSGAKDAEDAGGRDNVRDGGRARGRPERGDRGAQSGRGITRGSRGRERMPVNQPEAAPRGEERTEEKARGGRNGRGAGQTRGASGRGRGGSLGGSEARPDIFAAPEHVRGDSGRPFGKGRQDTDSSRGQDRKSRPRGARRAQAGRGRGRPANIAARGRRTTS
ncbi:hypothetical protein CERZMDRAFT_84696 [Cercospora zeae-maydis SCOH1-5]|uniref:Uncharacterized protein n=1 Tax=Cercospora zeae-maydis SCOH1-5 TaxID=717836 RepID=A0A6A6FFX2_9PEZI|nr:hypothetical protein CERZMDRAFT_84696 [Cercospora zeae-maydis SCOH1-5]